MKNKKIVIQFITILLLILWIPVSVDKVLHFNYFRNSILQQPFNNSFGYLLIYILPPLEIETCLFLLFRRAIGFRISTLLLATFCSYVALVVLGVFKTEGKSIILHLTWIELLCINLFFLIISIIGWQLTNQQQMDEMRENDLKTNQDKKE